MKSEIRYTIISDLHLGHTLRSESERLTAGTPLPFSKLRNVVRMDRCLSRFIDEHLTQETAQTPGPSLVLNGDIFDFLHVDVHPETGTFERPPLDGSEERLYGLSFEESRSRWKLGLIARLHRRVFEAFGRFLTAGGTLVFVVGNHDVDLYFASLQDDLRGYILEHVPAERRGAIAKKIRIEPWFFLSAPYVFMEHGHRFDAFTTFPDPLDPTSIGQNAQLAPNFAHYGLRYFANRVPSFPIYDLEQSPWRKIFGWIRNHSIAESFDALGAAFYFFFRYLQAMFSERKLWSSERAKNRFERRMRLLELANRYRWSLRRMVQLDRLKVEPVGHSPSRFIQAMQLDRIAIILSVLMFWIALAVSNHHQGLSFALLLSLFAAGLWWFLDRSRPHAELHPRLGDIAQEIGRVARVPIVVFGHTHQPTCESYGRVIWLNPGSWEHLAHGSHGGEDDVVHFGEIHSTDSGVCAQLCWYDVTDGQSGVVSRRGATFRDAS